MTLANLLCSLWIYTVVCNETSNIKHNKIFNRKTAIDNTAKPRKAELKNNGSKMPGEIK